VHFTLRGVAEGQSAWRSLDGGRTFRSWQSLTRMLVSDARYDARRPEYLIAHSRALPHRLYLRVGRTLTDRAARTTPDEAVFRSDDDGTTWRRVATGFAAARGGGGTVPWLGYAAIQDFQLAADGSLFATGWVRGTQRTAVFVSTDDGVHWREARG
jgi:hypothetical protein